MDPPRRRLPFAVDRGQLDQRRQDEGALPPVLQVARQRVGAVAERTDHAADGLVGLDRDLVLAPDALVQLAEGVGEQGESVTAGGVLDHALHEPGGEVHTTTLRRPFDHLGQPRPIERLDDECVVDHAGQPDPLRRGAEELGADRGGDPERAVLAQRPTQEMQEGLLLLRTAAGDELLGLVEDHQHRQRSIAVLRAQLEREIPEAGRSRAQACLHVVVRRSRVASVGQSGGDASGEVAGGLRTRPQRREHHPAVRRPVQPRQEPGA